MALHALLLGCLYYFGTYQIALRDGNAQLAASVRATAVARSARRVEDLQKIKELLEDSARREREPEPGIKPVPIPPSHDPHAQLKQARELSEAIEDISRDIKAEEQARLSGMTKQDARAEIDATLDATTNAPTPPAAPGAVDPVDEIARLETRAREVLEERAQDLARKQEGVAVSVEGDPAAQEGAGTQAVARIADFMGDDAAPPHAQRTRYRRGEGRLVNDGAGRIPHVDSGRAIKAQGRMLGAGGQYADRIYLNSWYVIGPFAGSGSRRHPPEDAVVLDAIYRGKGGRLVKWEYLNETGYPLVPREPAEDAIYYGYTEVLMDQERDLMVWMGADDDVEVYLNDKWMWKSKNTNKGWFFGTVYPNRNAFDQQFNRTESRKIVRFKKGRNKIFFKLSNETMEMFFSMVLTQPGDR